MAVPKKGRSKAKGRTRLSNWKAKGRKTADRAINLAKSIINDQSTFIFDPKKKKSEDGNINKDIEIDSKTDIEDK